MDAFMSMNCFALKSCLLGRLAPAPRQAPCRPVPQPGGRPPKGADGTTCKWDQREGSWCWWQSDGSRYQPPTAAERQKLSRQRKKDEQQQARSAAVQRERARRAAFTDEQRQAERATHAEAERERRAALTDEQRQAERATHAEAERERRAAFTDEELQAVRRPPKNPHFERQLELERQAQERRRAVRTDEQRQAEREAQAAAQRARRGVTSLYNALKLAVGQREDQMLYDFHASGSAPFTNESMRLRTLEEGSDLHAECVQDVLKEIPLRGKVTLADGARIVSAYAKRQRQAGQLHACGCCGVRDPSMWYSEQKRLLELPEDHWARIDDAAYADLLNASVLKLMNANREEVHVPQYEWHNYFEYRGSAYHIIPEALEYDDRSMPCIRVCKHCHKHWDRPRGKPRCERMDGQYDHIYWSGAPANSVAAGEDFGRLTHLKRKYGIETQCSRLEELVHAMVRTHYVSYKIVRALCVCRSACSSTHLLTHSLTCCRWPLTTKRNGAAFTATVSIRQRTCSCAAPLTTCGHRLSLCQPFASRKLLSDLPA